MIGRSDNPKEQALLQAGVRLFAERGYHAVNVEDILEASGVSRATFYARYKGKEDFFTAIVDALLEEESAYVLGLQQDLLAGGGDMAAMIERVIRTIAAQAAENGDAMRIFFDVVLRSGTRAAVRFRQMQRVTLDHFTNMLRRRMEEIGYAPAAARALGVLLIGGLSHVARAIVDGEIPAEEVEELAAGMRDLFTTDTSALRARKGKGR